MLTGRGARPQTNLHTYESRARAGPERCSTTAPRPCPTRSRSSPPSRAPCWPAAPTSIPRPAPPTLAGRILDITGLAELAGIARGPAAACASAPAPPGATSRDAALPPAFDALSAGRGRGRLGQIQNAGTVAGNLCNASPAADGVPPLLVLDAEVELASPPAAGACRSRIHPRQPPHRPAPRRDPHRHPRAGAAIARPLGLPEARRPPLSGDLDRHGRGAPGDRRTAASRGARSRSAPAARSRPACRRSRPRSSARRPTPASPTGSTHAAVAAALSADRRRPRRRRLSRRGGGRAAAPRPSPVAGGAAREPARARSSASS